MREIYILLIAVTLFFALRSLFMIIFRTDRMKIQNKRFQQLQFDKQNKGDMTASELLDKVTAPIIQNIIPRLGQINEHELERKLRMSKWDKHMSIVQYRALNILMKMVGIVMGGFFFTQNALFGAVWFAIPFFGVSYMMNNSSKNRVESLVIEFPDFIRVAQGYLTSTPTLIEAVEKTVPFVGEVWTPILENFVITSRIQSVEAGLDGIIHEADTPEIREFLSIIRLTMEQGGNPKEGFDLQAEKIQELIQDKMMRKIAKRKTLGILIQGPLLIANMAVMGLPTIGAFMDSGF